MALVTKKLDYGLLTRQGCGADAEREAAQEKLKVEEEHDLVLLDRCLRVSSGMMRLVMDHALGPHAVRFAGSLMAHCPLLDEKLNSIITQFIMCASVTAPSADPCHNVIFGRVSLHLHPLVLTQAFRLHVLKVLVERAQNWVHKAGQLLLRVAWFLV